MEADWEFELGGEAPVIVASWTGFVDLRRSPERAWDLPEVRLFPGLAEALIKLNSADSPVWTSKCDVWPDLGVDEFDPDELDAQPDCAAHPAGCYIDLLASAELWSDPATATAECKEICGLLRLIPLRCCRADLVIRRALVAVDVTSDPVGRLGFTAYLTSCGNSPAAAMQTLQAALKALADAIGVRQAPLDVKIGVGTGE